MTEKMTKDHGTEQYEAPKLTDHGLISELTETGGSPNVGADGITVYTS